MDFHSHYRVTDERTGTVHELCCYNECNTHAVISEEGFEDESTDSPEDGRNITNLDNTSGVNISLKNILENYKESIESEYRKRHKAYRAAMLNRVPSGYSSDESITIGAGKSAKSSIKRVVEKRPSKKIPLIIVDDPKDNECMEIDSTEFYGTADGTADSHVTDTGSSNDFRVHNNSMKDSSTLSNSNSTDNFSSGIVEIDTQQKSEAYNKALEDARNSMIALIDNFYLEQSMNINEIIASSSESQYFKHK